MVFGLVLEPSNDEAPSTRDQRRSAIRTNGENCWRVGQRCSSFRRTNVSKKLNSFSKNDKKNSYSSFERKKFSHPSAGFFSRDGRAIATETTRSRPVRGSQRDGENVQTEAKIHPAGDAAKSKKYFKDNKIKLVLVIRTPPSRQLVFLKTALETTKKPTTMKKRA